MTFNEWLEKPETQKIFLFEIQCAKKLTGMVLYGAGPAWYASMAQEISGVDEDGAALTERSTIALTEANAGSWYWDRSTQRLYVHTTGSDDPANYTIVIKHTLYLANADRAPYNSRYYEARIEGIPAFRREMQNVFFGRSMASFGDIVIANESGALNYLVNWVFAGQPFSAKLGGPELDDADYTTVLAGVCAKVPEITRQSIKIPVRDNAVLLRKKIPTTFLAAGANVPDASVGKEVPLCYGTCYNIKPLHTNSSTHEYQVHVDQIKDILAVYEDGVLTAKTVTKNLSAGTFTLSAAATGTVTCDVEGAYVGTFWELPGAIKKELLDDYLPDIDYVSADLTQLDTDRPYALGIYIAKQTEIGRIFDEIDESVCATSGFNRLGQFTTGAITLPGSTADVSFAGSAGNNEYIKFALTKDKIPDVVWRVIVDYRRDWAKTGEQDLTRTAVAEDSSIVYLFPYAIEKTVASLLAESADADAVGALHLDLLGVPLYFPRFTTKAKPFRVEFLEDVLVQNDDHNIDGYYTVIGLKEDYGRHQVEILCYGE